MQSWKDDPRSATNPLFNENKLKFGVFGLNSGHQIMTKAPNRYVADWDRTDAAAAACDKLGIETLVSLMGWFGNPEHEPFTWASALSARYRNPTFISTLHMPLMHPTFVAKAAATIDKISGGRFAINVVAGANPGTMSPFGVGLEDHETRYAHAAEFMELLKRLWTDETHFSFSGRFYNISKALSNPKPIQHFPPVMNAGTSGRGKDFACKYADLVFTLLEPDMEDARAQIAEYKNYAREQYQREIQVWTHGYTVIRETEKEAEEFLNFYAVEHADTEMITAWVKALGASSETDDPVKLARMHSHWAAGNGTRLVGTADQVADKMTKLANMGLDGILWNTIEPENLLAIAGRELLPQLEANGIRKPFKKV